MTMILRTPSINLVLYLFFTIIFFNENEVYANELSRRQESLHAIAAHTTTSSHGDDLRLVNRLIKAYQHHSKETDERGDSMWQSFFDQQHQLIHKTFMKGKEDKVAAILRYPSNSELFYGFDNLTSSILPGYASLEAQQGHAMICLDHLIRVAEAIGVISLDNPEGYHYTPPIQWEADTIISLISKKWGIPITFPNPYSFEYGLLTSSGVISYRVPQALYQAYRIKQMMKNIKNPRVLEIGAGLGRTAYYATLLGVKDYTIVDLPFTAISSGYFLGVTLGEDQILLSGETSTDAQQRIKIITPSEFLASDEKYDLIINADGFTEYDPSVARAYWNRIEKCTPIFLSINHESNSYSVETLINESTFDAEVNRFPYWMRRGYIEEIIQFKL